MLTKIDKYILLAIKGLLFLALFTPILVFFSLLYPFVTSKFFVFRIIVEIVAGLFFYLSLRYKEYRPRFSLLLAGLLIYSAILLISGLFGTDLNLSFWGDLERMGGIFTWLHFVAYFIVLASVFRNEKQWNYYLACSVFVSFLMSLYGLMQKFNLFGVYNAGAGRLDSLLGNPSYLAIYAFFNLFFIYYLLFIWKKRWQTALLCVLGGLQVLVMLSTGTRGIFIGAVAGLFIFGLLNIVFSVSRRRTILFGAALVVFLCLGLFVVKNTDFVSKKIPLLSRMIDISLSDETFNTRLIAWRAAWRGFQERPLLGVGPENFAIVFDKYFQSSFYTFTPTQTYFDRAHNIVFDLLSTSGILGLASYLFIFVVALRYSFQSFRRRQCSILLFSGFVAMLVVYFTQNLLVFDSQSSWLCFFVFLGLIYYKHFQTDSGATEKHVSALKQNNVVVLVVCALVAVWLIVFFNVRPILAMNKAKEAEYLIQRQHDLVGGFELYKQALSYHTPLDRDIRTQLSVTVGLNIAKYSKGLSNKIINEIFDYAIDEMKKNLSYNTQDNFFNLKLGELYNLWSDYNKKEPLDAEHYLQKAIDSSPGRLTGYYVLSQSKLLRKDWDGAIKLTQTAITMNPQFRDSYWHQAKAYYVAGRDEDAIRAVRIALLLGYLVNSRDDAEELLAIYYEKGEYRIIINLLHQIIGLEPGNAQLYGRLAMAYAAIDDKENARIYISKTKELDIDYAGEVQLFFEKLESGELCRVCGH